MPLPINARGTDGLDTMRMAPAATSGNWAPGSFVTSTDMQNYMANQPVLDNQVSEPLAIRAGNAVKYSIPGAVMAGVSDIVASVTPLAFEDSHKVAEWFGPDFSKFYRENESGLRLAGDIAGSFAVVGGVTKLLGSAPMIENGLAQLGPKGEMIAKFILPQAAGLEAKTAAYAERVSLLAKSAQQTFTAAADPQLGVLGREVLKHSFIDGLKTNVATDLALYATMNESEVMFPSDMSAWEKMALYGVPSAAFAGIGSLMTRHAMKEIVRGAGPEMAAAINPRGAPIGQRTYTPGRRGASTALDAILAADTKAAAANAVGDSILASNMNSHAQAWQAEVRDSLVAMGKDNVIGGGVTVPHVLAQSELKTAMDTVLADPAVATNIVSLQPFNANSSKAWYGNLKGLQTKTEKALAELSEKRKLGKIADDDFFAQSKTLQDKKAELDELHALVMEPDGSLSRLSQRRQHFGDAADDTVSVSRLTAGDIKDTLYSVKSMDGKPTTQVMANSQLRLFLPSAETDVKKLAGWAGKSVSTSQFAKLSTPEKSAAFTTLREATAKWLKQPLTAKDANGVVTELPKLRVRKDAHFAEIDAVLEVMDNAAGDAARLARIGVDTTHNAITPRVVDLTPENVAGLKGELELQSLASKYDAFREMTDKYAAALGGKIKLKPEQLLTNDDYITGLNLPNDGLGGSHPLVQLFSDMYLSGSKNFREAFKSADAVRRALQLKVDPKAVANTYAQDIALRGTQLSSKFADKKPVMAVMRGSMTNVPAYDDIVSQVAADHARIVERLLSPENDAKAPLLRQIMGRLMEDPTRYELSRRVDLLTEGSQLRKDTVVQTMSTVANSPVMIAADGLKDSAVDKVIHAYAQEQFKPHVAKINKLMAPGSEGDVASWAALANARGQGWRLAKDGAQEIAVDAKTTGIMYKLENHPFNQKKWKEMFGEEMPEEAFLPAPRTKKTAGAPQPLVSTPLAADVFESIAGLSRTVGEHYNALRKVQGLPPMNLTEFHLPAKNLADKEVLYLLDHNTGKLHTVVSGPSTNIVRQQAEREITNAAEKGNNLFVATQDDIANYYRIQDEAFAGLVDFSTAGRQTGAAKGTSYGELIEDGRETLRSMQNVLLRQYENIGRQITAVAYEPQLRWVAHAKATNQLGGAFKRGVETSPNAAKQTIWDVYQNRLLGLKSLKPEQSVGKAYFGAESIIDEKLQKLWDMKNARRAAQPITRATEREFAGLTEKLGDYVPFKDIHDYAAHTLQIKTPPSMRSSMTALNELTSFVGLRSFEVGLGLINILSLPSVIPAVVRGLARRPGESLEDWKATRSAFSSPLTDDIALWNPVRALISGQHFYWNGGAASKRMMADAAARGHLRHEVAERMSLMTEPFQSFGGRLARNVGKFTALWVDKTEEMSRTLSYATFYNMGRQSMKLGHEASLEFAHQMANKVIGDFRPNNRPRIFQGAVGMPLSLFTTYMWNYFQRVFSYMETGQLKALMAQVGWQTALFGTRSLPGWDFFVNNLTDNYDGSVNLVDRLDKAMGPGATDFLLYGSLQTLTNMSISQRADANIFLNAASFSMVKRVYNMAADVANAVKTEGGFSSGQVAEILARGIPNREIRNVLDLAAGHTTDGAGQIILDNTRDWHTALTRLAGFKTVKEQKVIEEFSRERVTRMRQQDIMDNLRHMIRASIRNGNFNSDTMEKAIKMYLDAGGSPSAFPDYLKEQAVRSLVDKTTLEAMDAVSDPNRQGDFMRLIRILGEE